MRTEHHINKKPETGNEERHYNTAVLEREWREASDLRSSTAGLALVVVSAVLLRFWNLSVLPVPAPGEAAVFDPLLAILRTGTSNPHHFEQPTLGIFLQLIVGIARFLAGAVAGRWTTVDACAPIDLAPWGRGFNALVGVATVLVVYRAGTRWGSRHALLAAGLVAVAPLNVAASHLVTATAPLTLLAALAFLYSIEATETGGPAAFLRAGIAAGLAAAVRYEGGAVLLLPLLAAWLTGNPNGTRLVRAGAAAGGWLLAFLVAVPFTLLDLPAFLNGFATWAAAERVPGGIGAAGILLVLLHTMRWPALILLLAGCGLVIVRAVTGPGHVRSILLIAFPVTWFALAARSGNGELLMIAPMVPSLCLIAAIAVISGVSLLRRFAIPRAPRTALIAALTIAAVLPPALLSIRLVREMGRGVIPTLIETSNAEGRR